MVRGTIEVRQGHLLGRDGHYFLMSRLGRIAKPDRHQPASSALNSGSRDSDGNRYGETSVVIAAKPAPQPLQVLLVGRQEEDFFLIREILERSRTLLSAELDHARSIDEAKSKLQQRPYGLVLFEHETGDAEAVQLVSQFQHAGVSVPFLLLTEDADEKTVAEIIESGTWNCVAKSQLDSATLVRSIRST